MGSLLQTLTLLGIISSFLIQTQAADKYTDGNRPYEFGFNIEGEQHRHEQKDEKGLIMGEFGFITADGVYHVTVYATDEQGRFKILSMKNIRVKPYPTYKEPSGSARQGHSLDLQTPQQTLLQGSSPPQKPEISVKAITIEKPGRSCSSCSIPTTTTRAPPVSAFVPNVQNAPTGAYGSPQYLQGAKTNSFSPGQQNFNGQHIGAAPSFSANQPNNFKSPQTFPQQVSTNLYTPDRNLVAPEQYSPTYPNINNAEGLNSPNLSKGPGSNYPAIPTYDKQNSPQNYPSGPQSSYPAEAIGQDIRTTPAQGFAPVGENKAVTSGRTAKKYDGQPQQTFGSQGSQQNGFQNSNQENPKKPTLISAQMQIVDRKTDIYQRGPGEREGLPTGLTKDDMTQLLYTFNYTVGFHGHFEEGYRNGAKQGYYYVTGRNGVRTRVDYVADENGFRPKITQEVLDLLSEDVPKEETEKEDKYGLKGYEFKWLYYPVESKGQ